LLAVATDWDRRRRLTGRVASGGRQRTDCPARVVLRSNEIRAWFEANRALNGAYRHLRLSEREAARDAGLNELSKLVREAHRDARERLERLMGVSLDPLDPGAVARPDVEVYPDALDTITLQGYLGEILAGVVAENYDPHGHQWTVPAFLFRGHAAAAQALERRRQLGGPARRGPGRTGDDALAFVTDDDGVITAWLYGEAKCTHDHNRQLIHSAHEQLSTEIYAPVDLTQLIEILDERGSADARRWADALRLLLLVPRDEAPERYDMLMYVCGRRPIQSQSWLSENGRFCSSRG
jgi:hypothetical protein